MKRAAFLLLLALAALAGAAQWRAERERSEQRKRYAELAVESYEKGAYDQALLYADRTEAIADDSRLRRFRAQVLMDLRRYDEAGEVLNRAIASDPDFASLYAVRAKLYAVQGDLDAAEQDLDRAVLRAAVDPDTDWTLTSIFLDLHRYEDALAACERATRARPGVAGILINCGLARAGLGDLAAAARDFDAAYAAASDHRGLRALALRGRARLSIGDPKGAASDLARLVQAGRAGSEELWALGAAHHAEGDFARAASAYAQALERQRVSDPRRPRITLAAQLASARRPLDPDLMPDL